MTHAEKEVRNQQIVELRKQGFSQSELAEQFGLTASGIRTICKRYGVAGVMSSRRGRKPKDYYHQNQHSNGILDRNEYARKIVEERQPDFEYLGGYTNSDGLVRLRCKECGSEFDRTFQSVRKGKAIKCDGCKREEEKRCSEEKAKKEEQRKKDKAQRQQDKEAERFLKTIIAKCEICGRIFTTTSTRQKCCSSECSKKRIWSRKDRRIKKEKRIDKGITAKALYARDNGTCWICGKLCDIKDYYIKDGITICGNSYPSVDHIIPVCEGGEDSWSNVKLAHRKCNNDRYYKKVTAPEKISGLGLTGTEDGPRIFPITRE